jgi:hypothetical protein
MNASIDKIKYVHRGGRDLFTAYVLLESGWHLLHGTFARGAERSVVTEGGLEGVCTDTIGARHSNIAGSTISEISESTILKDNPKILDL